MNGLADFAAAADDNLCPLTLGDCGRLERWIGAPLRSSHAARMLCTDEGVRHLRRISVLDGNNPTMHRAAFAEALMRVNGIAIAMTVRNVGSDHGDAGWMTNLVRTLSWPPDLIVSHTPRQLLIALGWHGSHVTCDSIDEAQRLVGELAAAEPAEPCEGDPVQQFVLGLQAMLRQLQLAASRPVRQVEPTRHVDCDAAGALWRLEQTLATYLRDRPAVFGD